MMELERAIERTEQIVGPLTEENIQIWNKVLNFLNRSVFK